MSTQTNGQINGVAVVRILREEFPLEDPNATWLKLLAAACAHENRAAAKKIEAAEETKEEKKRSRRTG